LNAEYICDLVKGLFLLDCYICKRKNNKGADIVVSSSNLIDYLLKQGIVPGNKVKNQVCVPGWIKQNLGYRVACLRGLMDTDGGVYIHQYKIAGKSYKYLKLCFTNCSQPLLDFAHETLKSLNIKAYKTGYHVSIFSAIGVKEYFQTVGSHNSKHFDRFKSHLERC